MGCYASHMKHRIEINTPGDLAVAVQMAREDRGLDQSQLAELTHTSRSTISRIERGLPASTATAIACLVECGYGLMAIPKTED